MTTTEYDVGFILFGLTSNKNVIASWNNMIFDYYDYWLGSTRFLPLFIFNCLLLALFRHSKCVVLNRLSLSFILIYPLHVYVHDYPYFLWLSDSTYWVFVEASWCFHLFHFLIINNMTNESGFLFRTWGNIQ